MKVSIHQPNHWPYLGFIHKMMAADIFVVFDTAQFVKDDYHHRNRVRNNSVEGYKWLTVPVEKKRVPIKDVRVDNGQLIKRMLWTDFHRHTIDDLYRTTPGYRDHEDFLEEIYGRRWDDLLSLNMAIIRYLAEIFEIKIPIIMSSDMECIRGFDCREEPPREEQESMSEADMYYWKNLRATKRIIAMCKEAGGDTYVSGISGKDYMMERLFDRAGLKVEYQSFRHPVYRQRYSPFMPNMSALDYIMNENPKDLDRQVGRC